MASETQTQPRPFPPEEAWPPDDTEESILGTDLHQTTITNLRWGLNEAARLNRTPEQPLPWKALSQMAILGCRRYDGSIYRTLPDVFVYPRAIDPNRGSLTLEVDGPPVLIIEVLSESTYGTDIDLVRGKGYTYARAGVREYLTIDPAGQFLTEQGRGWRLTGGVYQPWEPDAQGRWQSEQIGAAIGMEGVMATVYTPNGARQLREGEVAEEVERLRAEAHEAARLRAEVERLRRLLDEQQR